MMVHRLPNHQEVVGFGLVHLGANLDNSVKHYCCCCSHSIDIDFLKQYEDSKLLICVETYVCICFYLSWIQDSMNLFSSSCV